MKYRIIIDVEIDSDADIAELSQNTWEATVKEAQISHLRWVLEWMTSNKSEHNPAATKHAIAYHNTWADILGKAEFKLEKI
jgi:hypothetical protein